MSNKQKEKTIFLIEDNPDDEELTVLALRQHHIVNRIDVARDGEEAIEYLFNDSTRRLPQIILLDLKLPKVSGLEILKRIRSDSRTKLVPVIVLTTSKEDQDIVQSYQLGANSYVRKPVNFHQFDEAIRNLGMYWLVLNETIAEGADLPMNESSKKVG
jgi:DNA-binding response OmpR family regulator